MRTSEGSKMKALNKTLIVAIALFAFSAGFAQTPGVKGQGKPGQEGQHGRAGRMGKMVEVQKEILAQLNLNKKQSNQVEALNKARAEEMKKRAESFKQGGGQPDREKMRAEFKKNHEEYNSKLKAIIGEEKFAKYETLMKEKMKELRKKGEGGAAKKGGKGGGL